MISSVTGEIVFVSGVVFTPHCGFREEHMVHLRGRQELSIAGWSLHLLGEHESDRGRFEVQAVTDPACRICTVLLSHEHAFYVGETPADSERHAFHEGVIERDLGGAREFSWGEILCRVDGQTNRDWLVVVYQPGPHVPLHPPIPPQYLSVHAPLPELSPPPSSDDPFFFPWRAKGS